MAFALEKYARSGLFLAQPGVGEQVGSDGELTLYLSAARQFSDAKEAMDEKAFEKGWDERWIVRIEEHTIYEDDFNRYYGFGRWSRR